MTDEAETFPRPRRSHIFPREVSPQSNGCTAMPRASPEHQIQCAIVEFWNLRGRRDLELRAVPNGGLRNPVTARRLKAEGVRPGTPDMFVVLPNGRTGWIEIKTPKGRLTDEQKEFARKVLNLGHEWAVVKDLKDAQIVLAMWGALRGIREAAE